MYLETMKLLIMTVSGYPGVYRPASSDSRVCICLCRGQCWTNTKGGSDFLHLIAVWPPVQGYCGQRPEAGVHGAVLHKKGKWGHLNQKINAYTINVILFSQYLLSKSVFRNCPLKSTFKKSGCCLCSAWSSDWSSGYGIEWFLQDKE